MSLAWPKDPALLVTNEPRLHALVIGVSHYPHLAGGGGPPIIHDMEIGQVTTPKPTAMAVVDWLVNNYNNQACPLGSVELLLSEPPVSASGSPFEPATMTNIETAFKNWENRCSANADNVTFFYFCGHGLALDNQYLLPENFGDPANPSLWRNCIDFDGMRVGMRSCQAQTQLFFVDACRATPYAMLYHLNVDGISLISATTNDSVRCSASFYATTEGSKAYGLPNQPTFFCQALIQCLEGLAGTNAHGKWVVSSYSLTNALGEVLEHFGREYEQPLSCSTNVSGLALIHELNHALVIASIKCSTKKASNLAEIRLWRGSEAHESLVGQRKPLIARVGPGEWVVTVAFPGGEYASPTSVPCLMVPPVFEGVDVP